MGIIFLIVAIVFFVLWQKEKKAARGKADQAAADLTAANQCIEELSKYKTIINVEAHCKELREIAQKEAAGVREAAQQAAADVRKNAQSEADQLRAEAKGLREAAKVSRDTARQTMSKAEADAAQKIALADQQAKDIIDSAEGKAREIAGAAYDIKLKADEYQAMVTALKNTIEGYGDEWLKPTFSVLDELAADFSYTDGGQKLKDARAKSAMMVKAGTAASCDYVQDSRKSTAINFVLDAFNGKVDSILSKTKRDNHGKLEQQIRDAYQLVNMNGAAFRNAKITPEYLDARLEELRWAVVCNELKAQQQEEQRRIREQIREEEKARREYERAQKEAAKEEAMLRKAMEKAQAEMEKASAEQKTQYEAQLAELQQKLTEAEEKNQRALSMAQQTKRGNVYVISNIGSFGENVYKVGMTRRLEPLDRVKELGDASVPFPFDVHAIIESDDAPSLETALHKTLALMQVNKVNPKKEFFRVNLTDIKTIVEHMNLKANWTMEAAATEYRETLAIEESMKNDPDAKRRWEEYNASLAESTPDTEYESA